MGSSTEVPSFTKSLNDSLDSSPDIAIPQPITIAFGKALERITRDDLDTIEDATHYLTAEKKLAPFVKGIMGSSNKLATFIHELQVSDVVAINKGPTHEFEFTPMSPDPFPTVGIIFIGDEYAEALRSALNHHIGNTVTGMRGFAALISRNPSINMAEELDANTIFTAADHLHHTTEPLLSADAYTITMLPNQPVKITAHLNPQAA